MVICCHVWSVYGFGKRIPYSKQYRYVTNPLDLYVTNDYIFVWIATILLLIMCLTLVITNISWNTTVVIFGHISTGPMDLIFLLECITGACWCRSSKEQFFKLVLFKLQRETRGKTKTSGTHRVGVFKLY